MIKNLKLQPSEIDRMEFYRFEYLIKNLLEYNEKLKEEENNRKEENSPSIDKYMNEAKSMFNDTQKSFNLPNLSNFKF